MKYKKGVLSSSPRRTENHPGIPGWLPPYHVPHVDDPYSTLPWNIQGIPRRVFSRSGARPALTPVHAPPANVAFLLEIVGRRPGGSAPIKQLIMQHASLTGVVH